MSARPSDLQAVIEEMRAKVANGHCYPANLYVTDWADRLAALAPVTPASGVDWRAMYRFQTAMRFMDNVPKLTRDRAYQMADDEMRGLEAQTPSRDQGEGS